MKIFKFLQGLVGFGNLRFAEIKSCPSASPTYELRKVEISSKNDLAKGLGCNRQAAAIGRFFSSLNQWEASIFSVKE